MVTTTTSSSSSTTPTRVRWAEGLLTDAVGVWPVFMARGFILLGLGLAFIFFPRETVNIMSILFGVMLLFEAANASIQMCVIVNQTADNPLRGAILIFYFFMMLINITLGILAMAFPDETSRLLMTLVAVWFVSVGFMEVLFVCCLRRGGDLKQSTSATCCMFLGGVMYLVFGIMLLKDLDEGVVTVANLIGVVVMIFGLQVLCFGCFLRGVQRANQNSSNSDAKNNDGGESTDLTLRSEDYPSKKEESDII